MRAWYLPADTAARGLIFDEGRGRPISPEEVADASLLLAKAKEAADQQGPEYALEVTLSDGATRRYRGGMVWSPVRTEFVLREIAPTVPRFESDDTSVPRHIRSWLAHGALCAGGLVLIVGPVGSGKTTTASATVVERLHAFGGLAMAVEDPVEYKLAGAHGEGYCLQSEVGRGETYGEVLRRALRVYPPNNNNGMLFIGEVRDSAVAADALLSGTNGHLVIATLHADDIASGLRRLVTWGQERVGQGPARDLLAASFRVAVAQRLENGVVRARVLQNIDYRASQSLAERIKQGDFDSLAADLDAQRQIARRTG